MPKPLTERQAALRTVLSDFCRERLDLKLEKLADNDPKRDTLIAQHQPAAYLEDAARRVSQIKAATHTLKPNHPDARGSNLFCAPETLSSLAEVGSHVLGDDFTYDIVGNSAALDVYKLLKLTQEGQSLLDLCRANDPDLAIAMHDDPNVSQPWMQAFAGLLDPDTEARSHGYSPQVYWLVGDDPHNDSTFHLLAPLYPTSLVHRVYGAIQDARFGESSREARQARKKQEWHEASIRDYTHLAIQKLGGTKPQNIGQLNSERGGDNYLLASIPPIWKSTIKPLFEKATVFEAWGSHPTVGKRVRALRRFLTNDPPGNQATRLKRDAFIEALIDDLVQFTAQRRTLPAGWSNDPRCLLPEAHRAWLDPHGRAGYEGLAQTMAKEFAQWLAARLRPQLLIDEDDEDEMAHIRKLALDALQILED